MHVTGIFKTAVFGAALAAVLLLAACSSDSGSDDAAEEAAAASTTTTSTTAPPATEEPTAEATEEVEAPVEEEPTPEPTPGPSVIDTNDQEQVSAWQQTLATLGTDIVVDGDYGAGTEQATRDFQTFMELPVSGVVDQLTMDTANFLLAQPPEDQQAAPPPEGGGEGGGEPAPVDNTQTAEEQSARYEEAKTTCIDQHGLLMAGPCVAEAMCFDVEPVGAATECRRSYWQLWQNEPGAS